ncbi:MAG: hypothetical protein J6U08_11230 [Paludibacteraceae bacterium]|nr:hypothetical protein [Paludibacteraceae bacterium]
MNAVAKGYEMISSFNFESIPNFADRLDSILVSCVSDVGDMQSVAMLLCGLFALVYVGNMVWQGWCKGESINVYALLRPFAIGLVVINFTTFVHVLDDVCGWMNKPAKELVKEYAEKKNNLMEKNLRKCYDKMMENETKKETPKEGNVKPNVKNDGSIQNDFFSDKSEKESSSLPFVGEIAAAFKLSIMNMILGLLSIVAIVAAVGVLSIAFVSKLVLIYVGPFAFAISLVPYFSSSISNWIGRYITVSLYAPCVNITCYAMMNLFQKAAEGIGTNWEMGLGYYMILSLASAASFFSIPSIANYIVTSVGAGGLTGEGRMLAGSAARFVGPKMTMAANAIKNIKR